MRTTILFLAALSSFHALAQCPFEPTILPEQVMLCPGDDVVLSTQVHDAYQWYKDGTAIPGATSQTLTLPGEEAIGSLFTVLATLDDCSELSAGRLVDAWMFLPPYVIHGGDEPYGTTGEGGSLYCVGDTLLLTLGVGFSSNIQWTDHGVDIPGAQDPTLVVTTSGLYHVSAAPGECPNYILGLGVEISVEFAPNTQATILEQNGQLCADLVGTNYTWLLNSSPIAGTNDQACITPVGLGSYSVLVDQGLPCQAYSAPYVSTSTAEHVRATFAALFDPGHDRARIQWPFDMQPKGTWQLQDTSGRTVRRGAFSNLGHVTVDVSGMPTGPYHFRAVDDQRWAPLPILVVH